MKHCYAAWYLIVFHDKPSEGAQQRCHDFAIRSVSTDHLGRKSREIYSAAATTKPNEFSGRLGDTEKSNHATSDSPKNLESWFGLCKRLEGQHSKGGFTSLIAAMPMLLTDWTAELVRHRLPAVSVRQMQQWLPDELGTTPTCKRVTADQEFASATHG